MGGPGPETTLGQCVECGAVYTLRELSDGGFRRHAAEGACECGCETFRELGPDDVGPASDE